MKRAPDTLPIDLAAMPEVRADMSAVRVEQRRLTALLAKEHELAPHHAHSPHLARLELATEGDRKPACGISIQRMFGRKRCSHCKRLAYHA
jgi:hypothetical protein